MKYILRELQQNLEINISKIIFGDLDAHTFYNGLISRQKINKEIENLTLCYKSLDLTDIYRLFPSTTVEYTFSSAQSIHNLLY